MRTHVVAVVCFAQIIENTVWAASSGKWRAAGWRKMRCQRMRKNKEEAGKW